MGSPGHQSTTAYSSTVCSNINITKEVQTTYLNKLVPVAAEEDFNESSFRDCSEEVTADTGGPVAADDGC